MRKLLKTPTDYSKLYDQIYGRFATQRKYSVTTDYKATLMDNIFTTLPVDEITAVRVMLKGYGSYDHAAKIAKMDKKVLLKSYELGMKHLLSPNNIAIAVNGYYDIKGTKTPITKWDFDERQYIVSGLAKSGIIYREQLYRHIDNGWYFLWTIPRCGDVARQSILKAFDKWGYKHNIDDILTRAVDNG